MSTTADQNALAVGRTFVWHEIYAPNAEGVIDFYTRALGFGIQDYDMGSMGVYKMLTKDGAPVCGVVSTGDHPELKDVPPHWATYLAVDDVDASLEHCLQLGASVVVPVMDVPTVGRMVMIQDPQGAHLWLYRPASR
jgi:uncharacterized protein